MAARYTLETFALSPPLGLLNTARIGLKRSPIPLTHSQQNQPELDRISMGSTKPQPVKTPFEQNQREATTNTYGSYSVAGTPEAQAFLSQPLDFGDPTNVDPGIGRRIDLDEQEA